MNHEILKSKIRKLLEMCPTLGAGLGPLAFIEHLLTNTNMELPSTLLSENVVERMP